MTDKILNKLAALGLVPIVIIVNGVGIMVDPRRTGPFTKEIWSRWYRLYMRA